MTGKRDGLAIDLSHVTKTYRRRVRALQGIDLRVHPGEIFGLLGPNGAGKTTLVKIMMTVVRPSRAEGTVLARPIGHKPTLGRIGYLPEHPRFAPYLRGRQALEFYAAMAKIDRRTRKRRAAELLERLDLSQWARAKVRTYSKGMLQRLGLAQALINDPDRVLLDEPGEGLDPLGRRQVRQMLLDLRDRGKTVFVNSHLLGELEMICSRVAILVLGKTVRQGTLDDLTRARQYYEIEVHLDEAGKDADSIRKALSCVLRHAQQPAGPASAATAPLQAGWSNIEDLPADVFRGELHSGRWVESRGPYVRVEGADPRQVQPVLDALRRNDLVVRSVRPVRQSLEDLFVETVTKLPPGQEGHSARAPAAPPPLPGQTSSADRRPT